MPLFRRHDAMHPDLPLEPGEHVVATAAYDAGRLVATDRALWTVPDGAEPSRVHWDELDRGGWNEPVLTVHRLGGGAATSYRLTDPGRLPETLRERVTASIVLVRTERLATGGGVRIAARRRAGDDRLRWVVTYEREADAGDPRAVAEVERRLAELRGSIGG